MAERTLALLVVTYNSERWLPGFFESWRELGVEAEIVVADAGSATVPTADVGGAGVKVVTCGNVGYGAALNRAAAASSASWLVLCNPDVTFLPSFGEALLRPLLGGELAGRVFAPRLRNADGTVQASVGRFPRVRGILADQFRRRERRKYVVPQPTERGVVDWATGACLVVERSAFEGVGGFDEGYFLYVEEVDLQRRLRGEGGGGAGGGTIFVPEAEVVHHCPNAGGAVREEVQRWAARGTLRYFAKFGGAGQLWAYRMLAAGSGRLGWGEAFSSRGRILMRGTGEEAGGGFVERRAEGGR